MSDRPTRGERNRNPGNIDYSPSIQYVGQLGIEIVPPDESYRPRFARFDTDANGIRALCVLLKVYYQRHACDTVAKVIERWAPSSENNTRAYVDAVSNEMGVAADEIILLSQPGVMARLATAIIRHENGRVPYAEALIREAAENALGNPAPVRLVPRPVSLPPVPEAHAAIVEEPIPAPRVGLWQRIRELCGWGRE